MFRGQGCKDLRVRVKRIQKIRGSPRGLFSEPLATRALPLAASRFFKFIMWGGIDPWDPIYSDSFRVEQEDPRYSMLRKE
jgi:hypothetical protein